MKYVISTYNKKNYTGLQNKADDMDTAERVAKDSIRYAEQHFNDGTPLADYWAKITTRNGLHVKEVRL